MSTIDVRIDDVVSMLNLRIGFLSESSALASQLRLNFGFGLASLWEVDIEIPYPIPVVDRGTITATVAPTTIADA